MPARRPVRAMSWVSVSADRAVVSAGLKNLTLLLVAYAGLASTCLPIRQPEPLVLTATLMLAIQLVGLSLVDLAVLRLPNVLTASLGVSGLVVAALADPLEIGGRISAAAVGFVSLAAIGAAYEQIRGRPGLGLGDAKLLGAAGVWVGLEGLSSVVLYASALALAGVLFAAVGGRPATRATRSCPRPWCN